MIDIFRKMRNRFGSDPRLLSSCHFEPGSLRFGVLDYDEEGEQIGGQQRSPMTAFPEVEIDGLFRKLDLYICQLLNFPESDVSVITVTDVNFYGKGGERKVAFSFTKELDEGYRWGPTASPKLFARYMDGSPRAVPELIEQVLEDLRLCVLVALEDFAPTCKHLVIPEPEAESSAEAVPDVIPQDLFEETPEAVAHA